MSVLNISLKGHCDTRWCSKAAAVNSLHRQIVDVVSVLQGLSTNQSTNAESATGAKRLLKLINFQFVCLFVMWSWILTALDHVNQSLQAKSMTPLECCMACQTRCNVLLVLHVTDTGTAEIINKAKELAEQLNIEADFPVKRAPKKKRLVSEFRKCRWRKS